MFGPSSPTLSDARLARYEADRAMLATEFPGLHHVIRADGTGATAAGTIPIDIGAGFTESIQISVWFPQDYPKRPPVFFDLGERWVPEADRHVMPDHSFCLWLEGVDEPDVSTVEGLRDVLLRLVIFLHDQFVFDDIGHWPTSDWAHGRTPAYAQRVREVLGITSDNDLERLWPVAIGQPQALARRCPCGARKSYRRCHYDGILQLRRIRSHLRQYPESVKAEIRKQVRDAPSQTAA